ncbi:hypothetical protein NL676_022725 [Syzygium grande]|nr:hypothetical protein NL676_022725 [Syzygium grande]
MIVGCNAPPRELIAGILWLIWKARNSYVFQGRNLNPSTIVDEALALQKSFVLQYQIPKSLTKKSSDLPMGWMLLGKGLLKMNVDGSWINTSSEASIVGICRDTHGVSITGFMKKTRADSVKLVETLALREALQFFTEERKLGACSVLNERRSDW